ncbi:class I SAM-dependent methyltransferase [Legionella israelensis]|uniref:SAM-dependent methyltransferase n=1 Tax=Legionella israelensis TaxID=454 RepID=A0A0W0WQG6_9GAMM|nr:SAM-dependent methyltransferase [Legionella israelensis]KTD34570.1 hypothetical protein Lisr_0114 [Legionella israelensis]QBS09494.1 SAM-dependent methyltransferase [Legionella israelensis]SCX99691.1 SAM-dependent methyltransferase, MidA family [Legionella israelensis DSM 19235]STX60404.1 Uncharacterized ACR, COG1565 [Legionella israelensis]
MYLVDILRERLPAPFVDYMQQALYAPGLGYYSSGSAKLGKAGDFITAPELTPLFGYTLANQCRQIFTHLHSPCLFEFGAGTGQLCVDLLSGLEKLNSLPERYFILDVSASLRQRQQALIEEKIPTLAGRVEWLTEWPKTPFNGVAIANEVLDAMPVHRFMQTADGLLESFIHLDENDRLVERFQPCADERLTAYVKKVLPVSRCPYLSEVNLFMEGWLKECYSMLNQGALLIIDYGFPRHEYYHPDRNQGTIMCHYHHRAHSDFLAHPGEQDITAHVDFTHVAEAAFDAGFHVAGYTNQASFLLANGLLTLMSEADSDRKRLAMSQAAKQLLQPSEMGELFKVIALSKHLKTELSGFQLNDKRASL